MQKKLCSECGEIAEVSLCQIRLHGRPSGSKATMQHSRRAFCAACLQGRIKLLRRLGLHGIHKPLGEAFTTLADVCEMKLNRPRRPVRSLASDGGR